MKISIKVKDNLRSWDEEYDCESDPEKFAKNLIDNFNATLRPYERPRTFVSVTVLSESDFDKHDWDKDITRMSVNFRGSIIDGMKCKRCGITGKRRGLSSTVKIDSKYRKKCFQKCTTAKSELQNNPDKYRD